MKVLAFNMNTRLEGITPLFFPDMDLYEDYYQNPGMTSTVALVYRLSIYTNGFEMNLTPLPRLKGTTPGCGLFRDN